MQLKLFSRSREPPFTICRKNISLTPKLAEKTEYLGPLVRKLPHEIKKKKPEGKRVFSSIGGFGYRAKLLEKIVAVSKNLKSYQFDLVAGPNAARLPAGSNIHTYAQVQDPFGLMDRSSLVICGGGHSTIMESVCLGKPILSAPDAFHFEQESNASELQRLGLGTRIDYQTPAPAIEELILDHTQNPEMKKRLSRMVRLGRKLDGRKKIAELARELKQKK